MRQTSKLFCVVFALTCMCWCTNLSAQDFRPQSNQSWQPPRFQNPAPAQQPAYPNQLPHADEKWWPETAQRDGANVRPANLEVAVNDAQQKIERAQGVLTDLKDAASDKLNGLVGMVGDQKVTSDLKSRFANVDMKKMFGSLAVVLGGYFGFVWLVRRFQGGGAGRLPSEVLDVIGTAPFGPRKNLQLVRLGTKLLLLLNGPEGTHPIGEVTDPDEVQHLTKLCRSGNRRTADATDRVFKNVLGRFQVGEPATPTRRSRPQVSATIPPQPTTPVAQPTAENFSELERIVQRLSTVVQQNNGRSSFEA